jgi:hypothetical protein
VRIGARRIRCTIVVARYVGRNDNRLLVGKDDVTAESSGGIGGRLPIAAGVSQNLGKGISREPLANRLESSGSARRGVNPPGPFIVRLENEAGRVAAGRVVLSNAIPVPGSCIKGWAGRRGGGGRCGGGRCRGSGWGSAGVRLKCHQLGRSAAIGVLEGPVVGGGDPGPTSTLFELGLAFPDLGMALVEVSMAAASVHAALGVGGVLVVDSDLQELARATEENGKLPSSCQPRPRAHQSRLNKPPRQAARWTTSCTA